MSSLFLLSELGEKLESLVPIIWIKVGVFWKMANTSNSTRILPHKVKTQYMQFRSQIETLVFRACPPELNNNRKKPFTNPRFTAL